MADGGRAIPQAKADDNEDVSWALSTAEAMWSRGDLADAIKWVRRAAEAASDADADVRALELAKAAADLSSQFGAGGSNAPSAPPEAIPSRPPLRGSGGPPPIPRGSTPLPPPPMALSYSPASTTNTVPSPAARPEAQGANSQRRPSQASPRPQSTAPVAGRRMDAPRSSSPVPPPTVSSRPRLGGSGQMNRDVSPETDFSDDTQQVIVPVGPPRNSNRPRPPEPTPPAAVVAASAEAGFDATHTDEQRVVDLPRVSPADIDGWPTQAISGGGHAESGLASLAVAPPPMRAREPSRVPMDPDLLATQAVRVVVWRTADGVRVAPAGTVVSAIACDAVLVALDPTADLSAWLTNKP